MENNIEVILKQLVPYLGLILITIYLEFRIKYKKFLGIKNFYIRGIRIVTLIIVVIRLNECGGIFALISFVLTYIICAIMDNRYRKKIELCLEKGTKELNIYLKNKKPLKLRQWLEIRIKPFKESYKESYDIFKFKFILSIILLLAIYLLNKFLLRKLI